MGLAATLEENFEKSFVRLCHSATAFRVQILHSVHCTHKCEHVIFLKSSIAIKLRDALLYCDMSAVSTVSQISAYNIISAMVRPHPMVAAHVISKRKAFEIKTDSKSVIYLVPIVKGRAGFLQGLLKLPH